MSAAKASVKRVSESENIKSNRRRQTVVDDDFDAAISNDIKGIMSALQQIKEKAQMDGQKKNEEKISSVASEMKARLDELKSKLEKERQSFAKGLLKSSKECENVLKSETAKFQELFERFSKEKSTHLQALKDTVAKYEEEKEMLFARYEKLREQEGKKEKSMLSEHEKATAEKIAQLEESLKKKKQDDKTFSILRKSLGSFLGNASDEDFPLDE
ncbi:apolipoprotein A-IV [Striga asiatica]|uniref:Apolipoprotein A-IV n=1 Tax=Striga asiatica TaxID=4170 RepID=A0A5A7PUP3_STRAF|nr:apolipoprotein A-IV [Striga asiatica]